MNIKMKKKITIMISNVNKEHHTSEEDIIRDNKTRGILKIIHQRKLTKEKRVPNQWPDHLT